MKERIVKKDKTITTDSNEGTYDRSRSMVYALYYVRCLTNDKRSSIIRGIVEKAFLANDQEVMEKVIGCPLSELETYERDKGWESLSIQQKKVKIIEGSAPRYARYGREIQELFHWNGEEDTIFHEDLVSLYSHLPCSPKDVVFEITAKKRIVGRHISRSLYCFSRGIILYQYLYQGLVINQSLLMRLFTRDREDEILNSFLLHCCKAKGLTSYCKLMREASLTGLLRTIDHMVNCETLPNNKMREEVAVQLVIRSLDKSVIAPDDKVDPIDLSRVIRQKLANLATKLIGKNAGDDIRGKYLMVRSTKPIEEASPSVEVVDILPDASSFLDI